MYAIHTTPGFVLDSRPYGEADKIITLFTRDFGLVSASAISIRLEKSKLRYFCQDGSFGSFSLVRGREFWRLTSASADSATIDHPLIARLALLLRRLLHGEESNTDLFDAVKATADFLVSPIGQSLSEDDLKSLESLTVLRIMHLLGYVGSDSALDPFLGDAPLTTELIVQAGKGRTALNAHINKALKESHL